MNYIKRFIIGIILLELFNLIFGLLSNGKEALLPISGFNDPPLYYDIDSLYGVTRQKNATQMISYPWGGVIAKTNSLGFLDNEFVTNGVLITGNSFVEGYGINTKNRFTEVLEKKLNVSNINNAGSGGVWTPIQSLMVLKDLLKNKEMNFKRSIIILSPGEVVNLDKRNPSNDISRSYPYRFGDSIRFHKSNYSVFSIKLPFKDKAKRFIKSLLISKIFYTFKYYGTAKQKTNHVNFGSEKLDWFVKQVEKQQFDQVVDIVILNNLGRININHIENYSNKSVKVNFHVVNYPDDINNYFVSNGHLNNTGHTMLADLLLPIIK